jgi:hypothetical protein
VDDVDLAVVVDAAEAGRLDELLGAWSGAPDERALLARALRLDRGVIARRPDLALPCLYRRLAFVDAGLGARIAAAVRGRWLRALRAPPAGLDAGLVEEHRGGGAPAWATAAPTRWSCDRSSYGRMILDDGAGAQVVIEQLDARAGRALVDAGPLVLVTGEDAYDDMFAYLVDTAAQRIRWQIDAWLDAAAVHPDGQRLLVVERGRVAVLDLATGERRGGWQVAGAEAIAVSPDGALVATAGGPATRIWDLAAAIAATPPPFWSGPVELSPDGTRLLTGDRLTDAVTGAEIAVVDVTGPGNWLEGGPPLQDRLLCDGWVVELMPWGLRVWDARDGRAVVVERAIEARIGARVAVAPDGRHLAIGRQWPPHQLALRRLPDGALLFSEVVAVSELRFSDDGAQLHYTTADGATRALPTAPPHLPRPAPPLPAPPPAPAVLADGVLHLGDAAIPDDGWMVVVSADRRRVATSHGHYAVEGVSAS